MRKPAATEQEIRDHVREEIPKWVIKKPDGHWIWTKQLSDTNVPMYKKGKYTFSVRRFLMGMSTGNIVGTVAGGQVNRQCNKYRCVRPAHMDHGPKGKLTQ